MHADHQRGLEINDAAGSDAEGDEKQHGVDVECIKTDDPVLRAWPDEYPASATIAIAATSMIWAIGKRR